MLKVLESHRRESGKTKLQQKVIIWYSKNGPFSKFSSFHISVSFNLNYELEGTTTFRQWHKQYLLTQRGTVTIFFNLVP